MVSRLYLQASRSSICQGQAEVWRAGPICTIPVNGGYFQGVFVVADVKWIKVSTDMFESNRKIKQIELMPEGDTILFIWLKLLLLAGNVNDGGNIYLTPEIPYTEEMLANELRRPLTTVRMALSVFERFGMIEIIDDILHLSSWEKYQNIEGMEKIKEQNRLRQKKWYDKHKALDSPNAKPNVSITQPNDIEEEEELEKEKEIHSFNHSIAQGESEFSTEFSTAESQMEYMQGKLGEGVVFMSDEQFHDLLDILSLDELHKYFKIVVECEKQGKHFKKKTHYQAILDMAMKDRAVRKKGV